MDHPKAFISHASEDKMRFVLPFAEYLRANGVDAWVDKWEMLPGDSLVERIFEEGIKQADVFVIVLSEGSVNKQWVREELNTGVVARIEKATKIIPIVIDACEIPECLKAVVWERIDDLGNWRDQGQRILNAIYGISDKPKLGPLPSHASTIIETFPDLTKADALVFTTACEEAISQKRPFMLLQQIQEKLTAHDLTEADIQESLAALRRRGMLNADGVTGARIQNFTIPHHAFEKYVKRMIPNYENLVQRVCFLIVNEDLKSSDEIATKCNQQQAIIDHIFTSLDKSGLVQEVVPVRAPHWLRTISPELKRLLREQSDSI